MARKQITDTFIDPIGNAIAGVTVTFNPRGSGLVYATEEGGSPITSIVTGLDGSYEAWATDDTYEISADHTRFDEPRTRVEVVLLSVATSSEARAALAATPDALAVGVITRDANGAAISFGVVWPDGATGTYTGTASTTFAGAVDSYTVTHVLDGDTTTYTQPTVTRDASGVTTRPAITVS